MFNILVLLLLPLLLRFERICDDEESNTVVFVHSYSLDYPWCEGEDEGMIQGLANMGYFHGVNIHIERFFMNMRTHETLNFGETEKFQLGQEIMGQLANISYSMLVIFDDAVVNYLDIVYLQSISPVVFLGMNGNPLRYNETGKLKMDSFERPGHNITGVFTKIYVHRTIQFASCMFDIENSVIPVLVDNTSTGLTIQENMIEEINYYWQDYEKTNTTFEFYMVDTFQKLKDVVLELNQNPPPMLYTIAWTVYDEINDEVVDAQRLVDWIVENSRIPEFSPGVPSTEQGYFASLGGDAHLMGTEAGKMAGLIMSGEQDDMSVTVPGITIAFNLDRMEDLSISVNEELLCHAKTFRKEVTSTSFVTEIVISVIASLFICCICSFVLSCFCFFACLCCNRTRYRRRISRKNLEVTQLRKEKEEIEKEISTIIGSWKGNLESGIQFPKIFQKIRVEYSDLEFLEVLYDPHSLVKTKVAKFKLKEEIVAVKQLTIINDYTVRNFQKELHALLVAKVKEMDYFVKLKGVIFEYDVDDDENKQYTRLGIVLEYFEESLHDLILRYRRERNRASFRFVLKILGEICQAFSFLHDNSILHRDLKPSNIMIHNNSIKVIDLESSQDTEFNVAKTKTGTLQWMSPEMIGESNENEKNVTSKCDIYSFSMIMYQLMFMIPLPYSYDEVEFKDYRVYENDLRPSIPNERQITSKGGMSEFIDLIKRCWDKDPIKRPTFKDIEGELKIIGSLINPGQRTFRKKKRKKKKTIFGRFSKNEIEMRNLFPNEVKEEKKEEVIEIKDNNV